MGGCWRVRHLQKEQEREDGEQAGDVQGILKDCAGFSRHHRCPSQGSASIS